MSNLPILTRVTTWKVEINHKFKIRMILMLTFLKTNLKRQTLAIQAMMDPNSRIRKVITVRIIQTKRRSMKISHVPSRTGLWYLKVYRAKKMITLCKSTCCRRQRGSLMPLSSIRRERLPWKITLSKWTIAFRAWVSFLTLTTAQLPTSSSKRMRTCLKNSLFHCIKGIAAGTTTNTKNFGGGISRTMQTTLNKMFPFQIWIWSTMKIGATVTFTCLKKSSMPG